MPHLISESSRNIEKMAALRPNKREKLAEEDDNEEQKEDEQQQSQFVQQQLVQQQQPLRKRTEIIRGQKMEYYYVKTVKSLEELDKYRFKVMKKDKRFKK
jgi:hypothetical protein